MTSFRSPYIRIDCPDGPRFILKKSEKAFSIIAPDWNARVKALVRFYKNVQAIPEVQLSKKAKSIVKDLSENYASLQAHYQAAYLCFVSNPCSKINEKAYVDANEEIRKKEFYLRELEIETMLLSRQLPPIVACPKCGHNIAPPTHVEKGIGTILKCTGCNGAIRYHTRKNSVVNKTRQGTLKKIDEILSKFKPTN